MSAERDEDLRAAARRCSSTALTVRTARKAHRCECHRTITPGELYIRHSLAPNHADVGNVGWWVANECSACAERNGRADLLCMNEARP